MTKNYKAVLKSSLVMLVLFAVAGSGVAQAQDCIARVSDGNTVRAEGITEAVGHVELRCRGGATGSFGFDPPAEIELSIELNTHVTNAFAAMMEDDRILDGLTYTSGDPSLGNDGHYVGDDREVLSEDGNTITWKLDTSAIGIGNITDPGGTMTIKGIMANASAVGNGEDVTAVVRVNGTAAHSGTLKLADVTTGLDITVTAASGLQCMSDDMGQTATIKFVEGFASAIMDTHQLVLNFRDIPDNVTVTASVIGMGTPIDMDMGDLAPLTLKTGDMEGADEDGVVALSTAGMGQIVYMFDDGLTGTNRDILEGTDPATAKEWNEVTVTFTWASGDDAPPLGSGSVTVSYYPVSDDADKSPRYVSGPTNMVVTVVDCTTTLLFPYVTNTAGFDTGIAISNTSSEAGSCTISYHGANAPAGPMESSEIAGEGQMAFPVSSKVSQFQGYITAVCNFREAHGFAFITNGFAGTPELAQGYLAVRNPGD